MLITNHKGGQERYDPRRRPVNEFAVQFSAQRGGNEKTSVSMPPAEAVLPWAAPVSAEVAQQALRQLVESLESERPERFILDVPPMELEPDDQESRRLAARGWDSTASAGVWPGVFIQGIPPFLGQKRCRHCP